MEIEFRIIPGYESYGVSKCGIIKSFPRDLILSQYELNGYLIVDTFRGSLTGTLPVHRAVALAWVPNDDPILKNIVNHLNGIKLCNWYENLEWVTYSENNYHAVNTGLRSDNIPCRIRDFETGLVIKFASIAQACKYMDVQRGSQLETLLRKQFGALIKGRYEFKFDEDPSPWFYESRSEKIHPSRYMVIVTESDGTTREIYSTKNLLKEFQLYPRIYGGTIPDLVRYASEKYPETKFEVRDSYSEEKFRVKSHMEPNQAIPIQAWKGSRALCFTSISQTAEYFEVDRSSILNRLDTVK